MNDVTVLYEDIARRLGTGEVATALLVLADAIHEKTIIDPASAENLGHEIALMLRAVAINVNAETNVTMTDN